MYHNIRIYSYVLTYLLIRDYKYTYIYMYLYRHVS